MALTESGAPYGPGLDAFALTSERLLTVSVSHRRDLLRAMERSLRCRAVAAVIGKWRHGVIDMVAIAESLRRQTARARIARAPARADKAFIAPRAGSALRPPLEGKEKKVAAFRRASHPQSPRPDWGRMDLSNPVTAMSQFLGCFLRMSEPVAAPVFDPSAP